MTEIIARAQNSGALRADITMADMAFLTWGTSRTVEATAEINPNAWRRHLALMLDGLRAEAASPLRQPPLRPEEVARALRHC
jgi:hypothetical protein